MQKKKILIYSLIIVSVLSIFLLSKYIRKEPSSLDEVRLKDTVINKNNNLAIMLETEADSGEYEEADSIVFPKSQYKFNAELSGCLDMNGLKIDNVLTYKDGMAYVEVGSSAYCYLYFNLPPKFVNYLLNEKTRPISLWTSTLDGDGYRFVGGDTTETHCSYDGGEHTEALANSDDSCPMLYKNEYYDATEDTYSYTYSSSCSDYADDCYERSGVKVLPAPDNYICFGTTDKDSCVENTDLYMYRIIGIFKDSEGNNHLKLIKKNALGSKTWNAGMADISWEDSSLYSSLNGSDFLESTSYPYMQNDAWINMVTDWEWSSVKTLYTNPPLSGVNYGGMSSAEIYYHEMNHANKTETEGYWTRPIAKIGLMYVSDHMLSLGEVALSFHGTSNETLDGWMFINDSSYTREWTMVHEGGQSGYYYAYSIENTIYGVVSSYYVSGAAAARPVFYLNTDVLYDSGSGSLTDPFIIYTEAEESALPTYTITGSSNNTSAGTVTVNTPTVEHGGTAQWTISVNSGYYYSSNSCGATRSGNTLTLSNVTSDTSCKVYFYSSSSGTTYYTVTMASNGNGTVTPSSGSVAFGGSAMFTITPDNGYEYKGNDCGASRSGNTLTLTNVRSNVNCNVTFGVQSHDVSLSIYDSSAGEILDTITKTVDHFNTADIYFNSSYLYNGKTITDVSCTGQYSDIFYSSNWVSITRVESSLTCTATLTES